MNKNWIIIILVAILVVMVGLKSCEPVQEKQQIKEIHDTIKVIEKQIEKQAIEVVKWKKSKSEIHYVTQFDTLATFDTVYVELVKCDSIVKIDSLIIASQDTIIKEQTKIINKNDEEIKLVKKSGRKRERKGFGLGFVIGYLAGLATPI